MRRRLGDQAIKNGKSIGTAVQRSVRLVIAHTWRQLGDVVVRNVRWIAEDEIEAFAIDGSKQITLRETNALGHAVLDSVARRHRQRFGADVHGRYVRRLVVLGDGDGQATGTGADVENRRLGEILGQPQTFDHDAFGVRPRNQHGAIDFQLQRKKFLATNEIRHRATLDALPH